jgi:cyclopropane-fatty-acyl-phospholipid synthase
MSAVERLWLQMFGGLARAGSLSLILPDGRRTTVGSGAPAGDLEIHEYGALTDVARRGLLGFADAYLDGRLSTSDLRSLLAWGAANQRAWFDHPLARLTLPARRLAQRIRPHRRHHRVRTMNDHYNLGNDFYAAWLDETMTYSSARFAHPDQALPAAQHNKYRTIADRAGLGAGTRVLEIGCGWGGFAAYAAGERGCEVVAITLSDEQAAYATERLRAAGLDDKVEIRILHFREVSGTFDAVVSIEMIESVDETQWPDLFATMARSLTPGGVAAMQIITIIDSEWERYRSRADFIQQYIFPGGQLPAPKVLHGLADEAGLRVDQREPFGSDYARTLARWRERFVAAWPELSVSQGLDDRFYRMWDLYLTLCEAGFLLGRINVEQWAFSRPR